MKTHWSGTHLVGVMMLIGALLGCPAAVLAQNITSAQAGNWFEEATWNVAGIPAPGDDVAILHEVILDGDAGTNNRFRVQTHGSAHLIVTNGAQLATTVFSWVGMGAQSAGNALTMYSGDVTVVGGLSVGRFSSDPGAIVNLHGGTLTAGIGMAGTAGRFNLYGGMANLATLAIGGDYSAVDNPVAPVFAHYAGTNTTALIQIANAAAGLGEYHLYGGLIKLTSAGSLDGLHLSRGNRTPAPVAVLILGDADGTGAIEESVAGVKLWVGGTSPTEWPRVEGWCDNISLTGDLRNNGRVIANGWGAAEERTLDMRSFSGVVRTSHSSSSNGWFAVNRARLRLPPIPFETDAGAVAKTWGDNVGEASLVLVNSLRVTLDNVTTAGDLAVDLLAADRADVAVAPEGAQLIGVWNVDAGDLAFDTADVTMRYDDARAAATGVDGWAGKLAVFRDAGSGWTRLTAGLTVDTVNHRIAVAGLDGFSMLAVGVYESPAGTVLLVR